jgi:hypothetical protein
MSDIITFNNPILQQLYDISNSKIVADLKFPEDIENILYPHIRAVIDDMNAYEEAKKWISFDAVIKHIENNEKFFEKMNFNMSMCVSLYMSIYH